MKLEFDFLHGHENNRETQAILEANSDHLESQCKKLLRILKSGKRVTTKQLVKEFDISDPRRRIKDLRDSGVEIKDRIIGGRNKEYFL